MKLLPFRRQYVHRDTMATTIISAFKIDCMAGGNAVASFGSIQTRRTFPDVSVLSVSVMGYYLPHNYKKGTLGFFFY